MAYNSKSPNSESTGIKIKGIAFRSVIRALEQLRGEEAVTAAVDVMQDELRDRFRYNNIMATSWYPIEWYRDMFEAVVTTTREGERIVREIGREAARLDMTGIYKAVFKLLTPQTIFNLSTRMFSNYYNTGKVTIIKSRKGFVNVKFTGCVGFNRHLWVEIIGSSEMYLELAGANNVRVRAISGAGEDDDFAEVHAYWT